MLLHVFVRFEPKPGKHENFREQLALILEPTRDEPSCLRFSHYESVGEPHVFMIYSEWVDEAAFETHAALPHMKRFLDAVADLLTHPVQALRTKLIA
jgi:quinol monooxygenase YgiN